MEVDPSFHTSGIAERCCRLERTVVRALMLVLLFSVLSTTASTDAAATIEDKATTISSNGPGGKGGPVQGPKAAGGEKNKPGKESHHNLDHLAKAKRLAIIFGRSKKGDADLDNLTRSFTWEQFGPTYCEVGRVFTEGVAGEDGSVTVARNLTRGLDYLARAAHKYGYPHAQHRLAVAHVTGLYGEPPPLPVALPDATEAEEIGSGGEAAALLLNHFAAMAGDVAGSMAMGFRYLYGHGVAIDCEKAALYYEVAANVAVEELGRLKVLPPNERVRLFDGNLAGVTSQRKAAMEADQQLVDYYKHTAEKGDVSAQVALGKLYFHGSQGVPQNLAKAAVFLEEAARAGDPLAAGSIGHMYLLGVGVRQNNETARRFFVRGQESGDAASLNGLGHMYMYGMGVEKNVEKAIKLLQRAAHEKGYSEAFYNLGLIYAGLVGEKEEEKEKQGEGDRSRKSTSGGESDARADREEEPDSISLSAKHLQELREDPLLAGLPQEMFDKLADITLQAADFEKVARETLEKKGDKGIESKSGRLTASVTSAKELGERKGTRSLAKALKYFSLAAQTGHMGALHKLGQMSAQGIATPRACSTAVHAFKSVAERGPWVTAMSKALARHKRGDLLGALILYMHLAEIGYEVAQSNAALLLEEGTCGMLSPTACQALAVRYYRHASRQGNAEASLKVGDAHYYGTAGLPVDFSRAARYYQTAAELRQPQAMFNLGLMHQYGVGLKQDFHLAKRFLDASAEAYPDAKWPVNLALAGLYLHWWLMGEDQSLRESPIVTTAPGVSVLVEHSVLAKLARAWERKKEQWRQVWADMPASWGGGAGRAGASIGVGKEEETWSWPHILEMLSALDTLLIVALSSAFLYVMRLRAEQREEMARRRRGRQGSEGGVPRVADVGENTVPLTDYQEESRAVRSADENLDIDREQQD
ncbi:protein sel-1 [Nannochloropsis gaditana]|uniref:Protein sel-1 n=1 Tax=Nannochloropsis gaditana TaxID=72520 RepID=W7TVG9_9STRA|nr:protein sel-1 [Nannochloropsis gaditana]